MKKTKDLFGATSLICVLSTLINIVYAIDSFIHIHIFGGVLYTIFTIASMLCSVAFIFFKKQSNKFLMENKNWVLTFSVIALLCSVLGGVVALYAYSTLDILNQNNQEGSNYTNKTIVVDGVEIIDDKKMATYIDKINRLEELKNNGIITNDQYDSLKRQALNEYLYKGDD